MPGISRVRGDATVPERVVRHDDDSGEPVDGCLVGEAQTLPMSPKQKAQARRTRERLNILGGFGFQR